MASFPEKKRLAYQCLRCYHRDGLTYVDAKYRVTDHILKKHVPLDEVPYYCTLCLFKCSRWEQLLSHEKTFPRHKQMLISKGVKSCKEMYHASTRPFKVTERDMIALSSEESASFWQQRKETREDPVEQAMRAANLLGDNNQEKTLLSPPPVSRALVPGMSPGSVLPGTAQMNMRQLPIIQEPPARLQLNHQLGLGAIASPAIHLSTSNLPSQFSTTQITTPRAAASTSVRIVRSPAAAYAQPLLTPSALVQTMPPQQNIDISVAEEIPQADLPATTLVVRPPVVVSTAYTIDPATGSSEPPAVLARSLDPSIQASSMQAAPSIPTPPVLQPSSATLSPATDQLPKAVTPSASTSAERSSQEPFLHLQQLLASALQSAAGNLLATSNSTSLVKAAATANAEPPKEDKESNKVEAGTVVQSSTPPVEKAKEAEVENILNDILPAQDLDYDDVRPSSPSPSTASSSSSSTSSSSSIAELNQATLEKILKGVEENRAKIDRQSEILQQFCGCVLDMSHALRCTVKKSRTVETQTEENLTPKRKREEREEDLRRREDVRRVQRRHGESRREERHSRWRRQ